MKVLVTGVRGFIGARLLETAVSLWGKDHVVALTSKVLPGYSCVVYHDHTLNPVHNVNLVADVSVVLHAGAYIPKNAARADVVSACNANIRYTEQLLRLPFRELRKIVYLSTVDVYAPVAVTSEATLTNPLTLYGMSKLYCEKMIISHARATGLSAHILRIGHVYGPGEEAYAKVVPSTIVNILAGRPVSIWGDGSTLRSFIYIDDVVDAVLGALKPGFSLDLVNIASARSISIKALIDTLVSISGKQVVVKYEPAVGPKRDLVFDTSLLQGSLLPKETNLDIGLRREYEYMRHKAEHHL